MNNNERVLEKIRKCLAMANDGRGSPEEAAVALRQAQALMAKHGVTVRDAAGSAVNTQDVRSKVSITKTTQWELALFAVVGKAFGCELLWLPSRTGLPTDKGHYQFIGVAHNTEVAVYTVAVLLRQVMAARARFIAELPPYFSRGEKTKAGNGYCLGWVHSVHAVVHAFSDPDGSNKAAIEAYREREKLNGLKSAKARKTEADAWSWQRGAVDGADAQLNRGVNDTAAIAPRLAR